MAMNPLLVISLPFLLLMLLLAGIRPRLLDPLMRVLANPVFWLWVLPGYALLRTVGTVYRAGADLGFQPTARPRGGRRSSIMGLAGRDGFAGTPRIRPWRLGAACSRALSCAHGKTGLGLLPNPPEACLGPMPRTPLKPIPPGHDGFRARPPRKERRSKRIASLRSLGAEHGSALQNVSARKTVEAGWVGWRGV